MCVLFFFLFVEGYGMLFVEVFMLGVLVLVSDFGVFYEIVDDILDYLDLFDGFGWIVWICVYL